MMVSNQLSPAQLVYLSRKRPEPARLPWRLGASVILIMSLLLWLPLIWAILRVV